MVLPNKILPTPTMRFCLSVTNLRLQPTGLDNIVRRPYRTKPRFVQQAADSLIHGDQFSHFDDVDACRP